MIEKRRVMIESVWEMIKEIREMIDMVFRLIEKVLRLTENTIYKQGGLAIYLSIETKSPPESDYSGGISVSLKKNAPKNGSN
ncbi:hypothetical protein [Bacillus mesophilum]|uniref:Uncharacterized protein n=1 Tax=Bacillus mesophilum TaxID=1071718 RepID=A0A7V7RLX6_9BACI|nr:hypothetical protein [Bacillus mesophilum]KAB2332851.1 hypothetical protein F7732_12275 [Bacillus mesophilum]